MAGLRYRLSLPLQQRQISQRLGRALPAHLRRRPQAAADRRPLTRPEKATAVLGSQLAAAHPGRLPLRHAGNRRRDRRGNAAGSAAGTTGKGVLRHLHHGFAPREHQRYQAGGITAPNKHSTFLIFSTVSFRIRQAIKAAAGNTAGAGK